MQAAVSIQMNTRLDARLKEEGDRVLSSLGYSPSQAVRGLWEYVVAQRDCPENILRVLETEDDTDKNERIQTRLDALREGRGLCMKLGPLPEHVAVSSYDDLRDGMYATRYLEGA